MTAPRTSAAELVRALDAVASPVYALDCRRRIIFMNDACRRWLGEQAATALGAECRYHSIADVGGEVPLSGLLCPPPEAFAGQMAAAEISLRVALAETLDVRQVQFIPLPGKGDEPVAVLAIVSMEPQPASQPNPARAEDSAQLHDHLQQLLVMHRKRLGFNRLVGQSAAMQRVRAQASLAAGSQASTLIVGRPHSGRRHLAHAIYEAGPENRRGAIVPLACGLLNAELLMAGAQALKRRAVPAADDRVGTLMLEEADQLPAESQAALADLLQTADPPRTLATSRRQLIELAEAGQFRRDLASALCTVTIELPPLADRLEDLPLLAQLLLEEANAKGSKQLSGFSPDALDALSSYDWPGEVQELSELVAEAHARAEGTRVQLRDLPARLRLATDASRYARKTDDAIVLEQFMAEIERELIERALVRARGNKAKAARLLGMTRPRLYRRLVQLGFEEPVIFEEKTDS